MSEQQQPNKKLQQFQQELQELCNKYQYRIQPYLRYTKFGIVPAIEAQDVPPVKEKQQKTDNAENK